MPFFKRPRALRPAAVTPRIGTATNDRGSIFGTKSKVKGECCHSQQLSIVFVPTGYLGQPQGPQKPKPKRLAVLDASSQACKSLAKFLSHQIEICFSVISQHLCDAVASNLNQGLLGAQYAHLSPTCPLLSWCGLEGAGMGVDMCLCVLINVKALEWNSIASAETSWPLDLSHWVRFEASFC